MVNSNLLINSNVYTLQIDSDNDFTISDLDFYKSNKKSPGPSEGGDEAEEVNPGGGEYTDVNTDVPTYY